MLEWTNLKKIPLPIFNSNQSADQKRFIHSLVVPLALALVMFFVKSVEVLEDMTFVNWGIYPRLVDGLQGIFTAPLVHGDWGHLWSNLSSFVVLMVALVYFYRGVAYRVFLGIYVFSGLFVWCFGRESWHIGSSGIVYGMAAFLFFSGVIRQYVPLMAISLIVAFMYGSMVWGIFPLTAHLPYSWEAHLGGTLAGMGLALVVRNKGPRKPEKIWEDEDDEDVVTEDTHPLDDYLSENERMAN